MKANTTDQSTLWLLRAAIGLAAIHFPLSSQDGATVVSSRDAAFLLDGHLDVWHGWRRLDPEDTEHIACLLRLRRSEFADGEWVRRSLMDSLSAGTLPGCRLLEDADDQLVISCTPGMSLREFVSEALESIEKRSNVGRGITRDAKAGPHRTTIRVSTGPGNSTRVIDQQYNLPAHIVQQSQAAAPRLETSSSVEDILIPAADLIDLGAKIDAAHGDTSDYRARHITKLCGRLETRDGMISVTGAIALVAGEVRLLNAPTGTGKSVLMEAISCWMATHDLVVTLVVPTNADVLKMTRAMESNLEALGATAGVSALMSPSGMFKALEKVVHTRPAWDSSGEWTMQRLGYGCALAAAAETEATVDAWNPGAEPCVTLQPVGGADGKSVACPWRSTCGKFRLARASLNASVIVTSHANLHSGRLHLPVQDERGVNDRTTVEEVVFRRSHLVIIDEIDAFQAAVLSQAARGLVLDRRGSMATPLNELEAEYVMAAGKINRDVESSVRDMIHHSKFLASTYTAALAHGLIAADTSPERASLGRYWMVPRRWDGKLTAQLFGLTNEDPLSTEALTSFRSLFPGENLPEPGEPEIFPALRQIIANLTQVGSGAKVLETARDTLDELLTATISDDHERGTAINRLIQRAILERLRQHLRSFVFDAPHLASAGVPAAREIAETFGPYSRWRALPNGPLGRLLFAFNHSHDPTGRQPIRLNAAAFGGDPHAYTTTLADVTALCRTGTRRAVLGLSATAFFPLASHHHVHLDPHWWVKDEDPDGVTIQPAYVPDKRSATRKLIRVSGTEGRQRDDALRLLSESLWRTRLESELARLSYESPDRAKILLATTSYQGARMVAEGLVKAGAAPARICLAVRPQARPDIGDLGEDQTRATSWRELAADRLEEFPGYSGADILVAPLARVQRGINMIGAGDRSALGSIWLLVRPIPLIDDPAELIAHVNAYPLAPDASDIALRHLTHRRPADILDDRKQSAGRYFEQIVTSLPYFRSLPLNVQLAITAEIMNGIIQLVGRARRGGTPATIYLADGALLDPDAGPTFGQLVGKLRGQWSQTGQLVRMRELYGSTLEEFFRYADTEATLIAD